MSTIREISDTSTLRKFCEELVAEGPGFIALDTEFMREKTYWPKLCLIQVASRKARVLIDPLASKMDLAPFFEILKNPSIVKVFHAARQDMEIFYNAMKSLPTPIFDTQVAAMVCGFGESVGYEALVSNLLKQKLDKSARFTDWSRRPLTEAQKRYALDDVIYLREIYEILLEKIHKNSRDSWIEEEMRTLNSPENYNLDPEEVWRKIKFKKTNPRFLARLQALGSLREKSAQKWDIPRSWVLRDEVVSEIALNPPKSLEKLKQVRGFKATHPGLASQILEALKKAETLPEKDCPNLKAPAREAKGDPLVGDLLRILLKHQTNLHGVARKLVASSETLDRLAASKEDADLPVLKGWRHEVFGKVALKLLQGSLALKVNQQGRLKIDPLKES